MGRLRGPKLALMVCWGFAAVLTAYLVLSMLDYDTHNFWSGAV